MHGILVTIGRVLLGAFFVVSGLLKLKGGFDAGSLAGFAGYISSRIPVQLQPQMLAYAVIAFEIIAGVIIISGKFTTPVAFVLAMFCLATAILFHNFWASAPEQMQGQINNFLKNIGLAGAFLVLAGEGIRVKMNNA